MTPTDSTAGRARRPILLNVALAALFALAGGLVGWAWEVHRVSADPAGTLTGANRAAIEQVVQDYLMTHPEILPKAMDALEKQQNASQLASVRDDVTKPATGAVLGNPQGRVTLVEFTDYACTFCRHSVEDVDALIAANPDLRVVVRELPILTPESADAAKMALAAGEQGRYAAFHKAMFAAGRPDAQSIAAAAAAAGMDMARAQKVIADPKTEQELVRNLDLAKRLGFTGTPSWVVGDNLLTGAVGQEKLAQAIGAARS